MIWGYHYFRKHPYFLDGLKPPTRLHCRNFGLLLRLQVPPFRLSRRGTQADTAGAAAVTPGRGQRYVFFVVSLFEMLTQFAKYFFLKYFFTNQFNFIDFDYFRYGGWPNYWAHWAIISNNRWMANGCEWLWESHRIIFRRCEIMMTSFLYKFWWLWTFHVWFLDLCVILETLCSFVLSTSSIPKQASLHHTG